MWVHITICLRKSLFSRSLFLRRKKIYKDCEKKYFFLKKIVSLYFIFWYAMNICCDVAAFNSVWWSSTYAIRKYILNYNFRSYTFRWRISFSTVLDFKEREESTTSNTDTEEVRKEYAHIFQDIPSRTYCSLWVIWDGLVQNMTK